MPDTVFSTVKINGESLYDLGNGRYIGVDRGADDERIVECEVQQNPDGSITVLDIREYPPVAK